MAAYQPISSAPDTAIAGKSGSSLPDFAERDLNNVTNTARILVQGVSDVFRVIEHRRFDSPVVA